MKLADQAALEALDARLRTILPEEYQDTYDDVEPVSMGSAGLKYGSDGKVAWDDIWDHFCDLAMAGGPPHKGTLLEPGSREEIEAQPDRYLEVAAEICRGVTMVTELVAEPTQVPGWLCLDCADAGMAAWMLRAIVMENVSAHLEGTLVFLPAGPDYRIEKEIKNVVTAVAKTSHYWLGHMWSAQQREITELFAKMDAESPLIQPARVGDPVLAGTLAQNIERETGLRRSGHEYAGWLGVNCQSVRAAIWMMRAMVASNVLSRREETVLFVPVNPKNDPDGERVAQSLARVHEFALARNVLSKTQSQQS